MNLFLSWPWVTCSVGWPWTLPGDEVPNREKETTQQIHPIRAVIRTVIAMGIGFIPVGSLLIRELGLDSIPFFAGALGLGAAITRVLAFPETAAFLKKWAPWLHETGYKGRHRLEDRDDGEMHRSS